MQIDFHHAATYVIARYAGFGHHEAGIVAYCAQYVDDATNSGAIKFKNGAMYSRISSAHKALDYRHFNQLASHYVWIPFHFLPGNGGKPAGENPSGSFIEKLICRPNSYVARDMVRACILEKDKLYGLHRLGITMHVYADTWAHQGFAGVIHEVNDIRALNERGEEDCEFLEKMKGFFGGVFDRGASKFVGDALPLGHGAALSCPDKPYLTWMYKDHRGRVVERNNTSAFVEAAEQMCHAMQCYRAADPDADVSGLPQQGREKIEELLSSITGENGDDRHEKWIEKIAEGYFDFPAAELSYCAKGVGSWKYLALSTRGFKDRASDVYPYTPLFLSCDWKLFHDALQDHRFYVVHNLLPRYGICAA